MAEDKKPEESQKVPEEFSVKEIPESYQRVISLGDKIVNPDVLLVLAANSLVKNGLLNLKELEGK